MQAEQTAFEFLIPYSRELLRPDEVADIIRFDRDTVYALAEGGKLEVHQGEVARSHIRITRRSLLLWLARTARYQPDDIVQTLHHQARKLNPAQRAELVKLLTA